MSARPRAPRRRSWSRRSGAFARRTPGRWRCSSGPAARCWAACRCTGWCAGPAGSRCSSTGGEGAHLTDVDGHRYLDLCLGDTGAMTGHAPAATVEAVRAQAGRGFTFMLPTEDAVWVGEELARRFGLPYWQFAVTATDANRFAIRLARADHRPAPDPGLQLVLSRHRGRDLRRPCATAGSWRATGTSGPRWTRRSRPGWSSSTTCRRSRPRWPTATWRACWPSRRSPTSASSIPEPGFHAALRELTRRAGTLLIIDETHTICAGPGGYTRRPRPRARHPDARQAGGGRRAGRGLRLERGGGGAGPGRAAGSTWRTPAASAARWPPTRSPRAAMRADARARADRGELPAHHSAGRALRARRRGGDRRAAPALDREAAGLPGGVLVPAGAAPERRPRPRRRWTPSSSATCTWRRSTAASC